MSRIQKLCMPLTAAAFAAALCSDAAGQQFLKNTADIPVGPSHATENVDFADIDLDGDWDAAFGDGGDFDQQQDTLWLNRGPAQLGIFQDVTASRFPAILDQTRDIEFVDFDNDSDPDLYISNTTQLMPQGNRWWRNNLVGSGTYIDETGFRWVNLGVNDGSTTFSSIAPSGVLGDTFIDWSCDCDFGDIDNDGDLDLFHSSYGGAFGGLVPSRIFLNDGAGHFEEYNPSGFQLSGTSINNGDPALWAEGTHQQNTNNSTGTQADISGTPLDIDLGDMDGDLDLDLLFGDRQGTGNGGPRLFENRLDEGGAFRSRNDWLLEKATSGDNYEQEMGDIDGDGDLDLYGLNWDGFSDSIQFNDGTGHYGLFTTLAGSGSDDNEGDFFDYDLDGDLDLYVANFSGADRMYRNNGSGVYTLMATGTIIPNVNVTSLDADAADVDNDGDYDIFVAADNNQPNWYLENTTTANDVTAPYLNLLEQAPDRAPSAIPTVVRVQVYDNAPYYATWYADVTLEYQVNGGAFTQVAMHSSAGQIFRAEIPGNLVGNVCYRAFATDEHNNTSTTTAALCFSSGDFPTVYCTPKLSSAFCLNFISTSDLNAQPVSLANDYAVTCSDVQGFKNGLLFAGISGPAVIPFSGGTLCVAPPNKRGPVMNSGGTSPVNCTGTFSTTVNDAIIPFGLDAGAGNSGWYQYWYRDPNNGAGTLGTALSDAVELDFL